MSVLALTKHYRKSAGAALIMVLGILSVISILAVQIIDTSQHLTRQQVGLKQLQQVYWYARSGEEYARYLSKEYLFQKELKKEETDLSFPIEDGVLKITLKPMQNCFNINSFSERSGVDVINRTVFDNLKTPSQSDQTQLNVTTDIDPSFIGLPLKRRQINALFLMLDIDQQYSSLFADRLMDWLDEDHLPTGSYGAESTFYSSETPARLSPNNHTLLVSEMQGFLGEDYRYFAKVLPYLCARPGDNKLDININQLTQHNAILLSAVLLGKIDEETAKGIIKDRPKEGFTDLDTFWQLPALKALKTHPTQKKSISLENHHFMVQTDVQYKDTHYTLHSLIRVNKDKTVQVISRQYGVLL
jgi:general secretion pathway protein K